MIGLAIAVAVVAAVVAVGLRRLRRARLRRAAAHRAGASLELAIPIRSFGEIDGVLAERWCHCGGYLERLGEGTRDADGRRYRVARLQCQECEAVTEVFFETTEVLH
jgi:hypothetical protein